MSLLIVIIVLIVKWHTKNVLYRQLDIAVQLSIKEQAHIRSED